MAALIDFDGGNSDLILPFCYEHDLCYATPYHLTKYQCDLQLFCGALSTCDAQYPSFSCDRISFSLDADVCVCEAAARDIFIGVQ